MELVRSSRSCIPGKARAFALLFLALGGGNALALDAPPAVKTLPPANPRIVNGEATSQFPTVGALLYGDSSYRMLVCSGTMIGCKTFLTAAHCVCPTTGSQCQPGEIFEPPPSALYVYLQHAGIFPVASVSLLPTYSFPDDDIAILKLADEVVGIPPSKNSTTDPVMGAVGSIVGFGRTGGDPGDNFDYGIKRYGTTALEPCSGGIDPQKSICWNYTGGSEANTCNGDSGGPMFIDYGSGEVVAGVTSGGSSLTCLELDFSYDANVANYADFISSAGGSDILNEACGTMPPVGDPRTSVFWALGRIADSAVSYTILVPSGTERLVFTLNGVDDGIQDFNLYVRQGSTATTAQYDCASVYAGQFESCVFDQPVAGEWSALIYPFAGYGDFQFTATALGAKPCGDAAACDDGNPCTDDSCEAGFCAYSPNSASCDDGLFCNGADSCAGGSCSVHTGDPCGGSFCLEPYRTCMVTCPGTCGAELADRKRAKAVEKFLKKMARAIKKCGRNGDPACPTPCPLPAGSFPGLSPTCLEMLSCRASEMAATFYGEPYRNSWDSHGLCALSPASKCGIARAKQGYKLIVKALRRKRTGTLWRTDSDVKKCSARVEKAGECDGARVCFAASLWANAVSDQRN